MRRILVVDDSMTMRALYRQILSHIARTSLTFAADGVQALECVERSEPHLMFLDINMPRMNGLEVLKELGQRGVLARTAVVLVSTEGKDDDLRRGRDAGATEYLRKPFAMNALAPIVERLVPAALAGAEPAPAGAGPETRGVVLRGGEGALGASGRQ